MNFSKIFIFFFTRLKCYEITYNATAIWTDNGDLDCDFRGSTSGSARTGVASMNAFDLSAGFKLEVSFTVAAVDGGRLNIGLVDAWDSSIRNFLGDSQSYYGIGFVPTTETGNQGLNFNSGGTLIGLSNAQTISDDDVSLDEFTIISSTDAVDWSVLNVMQYLIDYVDTAEKITDYKALPEDERSEQKAINLDGYLFCPKEGTPESFNAGYTMYPSIWSLVETHPGKSYQSGLVGTWLSPQNDDNSSMAIGSENEGGISYTKIEGGLGVWRSNNFPTRTPKFHMGGVALSFKGIADGPGIGKGDFDDPKGVYGVAQLSPWVVFPPDGLNFKQGSMGEVFGYGYLPLPLTPAKTTTAGQDVPTGDHSWTLFVNTKTFKGPLAFFTPYFWSRHTLDYPNLHGKYFDSRPSKTTRQISMETQHISAIQASDAEGNIYARLTQVRFPLDSRGLSPLLTGNTNYDKSALWDAVDAWFNGGPVASGQFNPAGAYNPKVTSANSNGWKFYGNDEKYSIAWSNFAQRELANDYTLTFKWSHLLTRQDAACGVVDLPEYYQLVMTGETSGKWYPVAPGQVPCETGLHQLIAEDFHTGENSHDALTTPEEVDSIWKTPGPAAGPFTVELGDGTTLTYYWYRFCDQPAILYTDLTEAEREALQVRVELLHAHWTKDKEYLAAPPVGEELVDLDPALIVTLPAGLEIGYVPIATYQGY